MTFLIGWYFFGGGVRIVGTQEKGKLRTTPSFALAMLIVNFVGVVRGFRCLVKTFATPDFFLGTEKVPQRNCVTKIGPNVRVNFLVRFASKPLSYWAMTR